MSSDVDDEQILPESLQKLEIVPEYSQSKLNNEPTQNPFFSPLAANISDDRLTKDLFGPTCSNCESNDIPCSAGKDTTKNWRHRSNISQCIVHNIYKQCHFKHRDKDKHILSEKKLTILREPILKSIGRSMYHNSKEKLCCESQDDIYTDNLNTNQWFDGKSCNETNNEHQNKNCQTIKSIMEHTTKSKRLSNNNNVMIHKIANWQLNETSLDFKSLVNDLNDSLKLSTDAAINSITQLHKTKNFQILQENQVNELQCSTDVIFPSTSNQMNSSMCSNGSNSSSCSQQARMNSNNCDVTIDELASYIEFQLHLPKPMSSNVYEAMFS